MSTQSTEQVIHHSRLPPTITPDAALDLLHDHEAFFALQASITSNLPIDPPNEDSDSWLQQELDARIKFIVDEVFGSPPPDPPRQTWSSWGPIDPWAAIWNGNRKWEMAMRLRTSFRELKFATAVTGGMIQTVTSAHTTFQRGILVVEEGKEGVRRVGVWWLAQAEGEAEGEPEGETEKKVTAEETETAGTTAEEAEVAGSAGVEGKEVETQTYWYLFKQATTTADSSVIESLLVDEQAEHVEFVKRFFTALEERAAEPGEEAGAEENANADVS